MEPSPITPLGARTPHMHPALPGIITGFVIIILAGAYFVWADYSGHWPYERSSYNTAGPDEHCGGNIATALSCQTGYHCAPDPASHLPFGDVGGICVADSTTAGLHYENEQYGFSLALPDSWQNYTVIDDQWEGRGVASGTVTEHGPLIKIRNPNWTSAAPYEDMPVMVFTPAQWTKVQAQTLSLGAAPIGPSELAHNSSYIFALPARYNYDFATGYEEVDQLVHQLQAFDPAQ